jgi:hypothetical protein
LVLDGDNSWFESAFEDGLKEKELVENVNRYNVILARMIIVMYCSVGSRNIWLMRDVFYGIEVLFARKSSV